MSTFLQTSNHLQIFAGKNYAMIFGTEPFQRIYHQSIGVVFTIFHFLKSACFPFLRFLNHHFFLHAVHLQRGGACAL